MLMLKTPFFLEVCYLYCLFLFLSSSSILLFWLFAELNLCMILLLLCKKNLLDNDSYKFNLGVYYFIIQSLGSMIFLAASCLSELFPLFIIKFILCLSLMAKAGLWPFHFWFFNFGLSSPSFIFFLMLTLQKFPLLMMMFVLSFQTLIFFFLMNMIVGVYYLFHSYSNLFFALISSSLYSVVWVYLFFVNSLFCYVYYFAGYSVTIMFLCKAKILNVLNQNKILLMSAVLFLLSLPPFGMFFLKLSSLIYLSKFCSEFLMVLVWFISFASLIGYMGVFYSIFMSQANIYAMKFNKIHYSKLNVSMIFLFFLSFMFIF